MATTYPRTLLPGSAPPSELRVFTALRDALPEPWEVFHSVDVVALAGHSGGPGRGAAAETARARANPNAGRRDGEVDFVLVHPDEPVICLEVKGGGMETRAGEWRRKLGDGGTEPMRDPFRQAADHKFELGRAIDEHRSAAVRRLDDPGLPPRVRRQAETIARLPRAREMLIVHALALPDLPVHGLVLGADAPPEIVIDAGGLRDVEASLRRVVAHWRGKQDPRRPPGPGGVDALRELLAPTQTLETVLAAEFVDEARQLVELTRTQTRVMRGLANQPHVAVSGCAGSGKTMLAVAHAKRLAAVGQEVLVCCFNRSLAAHLEREESHERVTYGTFHGVCARTAERAGLEVPRYDGPPPPEHWRDDLPELLLEALEVLGPQWDALVVDEAQDLRDHWLEAVRCGLRGGEDAPTWLFLDARQRLYDVGDLRIPPGFVGFELHENCRTTQAIHRELVTLRRGGIRPGGVASGEDGAGDGDRSPGTAETFVGDVMPEAVGPEGRPVEVVPSADPAADVREIVTRLLEREGVRPSELVLLTPRRAERSACAAALDRRVHTGPPDERPAHLVQASSIGAFKGLEADVVVVCELDEAREGTAEAQRYVALSRARHHVVEVRAV